MFLVRVIANASDSGIYFKRPLKMRRNAISIDDENSCKIVRSFNTHTSERVLFLKHKITKPCDENNSVVKRRCYTKMRESSKFSDITTSIETI